MGLCLRCLPNLASLPSLPSLQNVPIRSQNARKTFKSFKPLLDAPTIPLTIFVFCYYATYIPYIPYVTFVTSLPNASIRSPNALNVFKCFSNASISSKALAIVPIGSAYAYTHTWHTLPYYHTIWFYAAQPAKRSHTHSNVSTTLQDAPQRCPTFTNALYACSHTLPYHTTRDYAYHTNIITTKTIHIT